MQFLLYVFGNFCCLSAAGLLLWHQAIKPRMGMSNTNADGSRMLVSRDLQVLLCMGAFARVYWSVSPPPVWSSEPLWIQWMSWFDVYFTPLLWSCVVAFVTFGAIVTPFVEKTVRRIKEDAPGMIQVGGGAGAANNGFDSNNFGLGGSMQENHGEHLHHRNLHSYASTGADSSSSFQAQPTFEKEDYEAPIYFTWPALALAGVLAALVGPTILGSYDEFSSWDYAVHMVVFNMTIEALAMIPQMHLIAYAKTKASGATSHFVGLLSLGRVLRVIFWLTLLGPKILEGHYSGVMWEFVLPDIIHTIIMGDYLWLWMKKVKRDKIDVLMNDFAMNV